MKIRLLHNYKGLLSNYEKLLAGEHDLEESLAQYLVDNGHAVAVATQAVKITPELLGLPPLAELRNRYKELAGKGAFNGWDAQTLQAKITELESEDA